MKFINKKRQEFAFIPSKCIHKLDSYSYFVLKLTDKIGQSYAALHHNGNLIERLNCYIYNFLGLKNILNFRNEIKVYLNFL